MTKSTKTAEVLPFPSKQQREQRTSTTPTTEQLEDPFNYTYECPCGAIDKFELRADGTVYCTNCGSGGLKVELPPGIFD
tara:strand:- start:287 stop:523 length:237 start_codon:yes stop_codon:yes gene_type:complete